jgi:hypothetical protein
VSQDDNSAEIGSTRCRRCDKVVRYGIPHGCEASQVAPEPVEWVRCFSCGQPIAYGIAHSCSTGFTAATAPDYSPQLSKIGAARERIARHMETQR